MARIAVLGTGIMGAPMARNLARAGHEVHAWNRSAEKAQPLRDDGVTVHDEPAAATAEAEIVMTMLSAIDAVLSVVDDADLKAEQVWWQASTVGIEGFDRCAARAQELGVTVVDAPVLGTRQPAQDGKLVVLAAGPQDALDVLQPAFDAVSVRTIRLGEAGQATRLKLAVNSWVLALSQATAETVAFAQSLGLDPQLVADAISGGVLDVAYFGMKLKLMLEEDFPPSFSLELAAKDARLIVAAAGDTGADLPAMRAIADRLTEATDAGHGEADMAATYLLSRAG